ncbi:unnamed protein product [Gadus morhua 'NCC']
MLSEAQCWADTSLLTKQLSTNIQHIWLERRGAGGQKLEEKEDLLIHPCHLSAGSPPRGPSVNRPGGGSLRLPRRPSAEHGWLREHTAGSSPNALGRVSGPLGALAVNADIIQRPRGRSHLPENSPLVEPFPGAPPQEGSGWALLRGPLDGWPLLSLSRTEAPQPDLNPGGRGACLGVGLRAADTTWRGRMWQETPPTEPCCSSLTGSTSSSLTLLPLPPPPCSPPSSPSLLPPSLLLTLLPLPAPHPPHPSCSSPSSPSLLLTLLPLLLLPLPAPHPPPPPCSSPSSPPCSSPSSPYCSSPSSPSLLPSLLLTLLFPSPPSLLVLENSGIQI